MTPLLTILDVAERLNVKPGTVYKWISKRKITTIKLPGGDLRFKEEEVENWLERRTIKKKAS